MIDLSNKNHFEALGLLLKNEQLLICKTIEEPVLISGVTEIEVQKGVSVSIIDTSSDKRIHLSSCENSKVEYQVLFSANTERIMDCKGDLHYVEVSLKKTEESLTINILKKGITVSVEELSIANQDETIFHQQIHHLSPEASSNISNFGVAMNGANILFDTTGKIENKMSKSKCVQLSKGVIMDDDSMITSKPILLIDEYDVVANHGASIGKMSDDILFYLMSRGLSKTEAFLLILEGIIAPFVEQIKYEQFKTEINEQLKFLTKR